MEYKNLIFKKKNIEGKEISQHQSHWILLKLTY